MAVAHLVGAAIMVGLAIAVVVATMRGRRWYRYSPQTTREVGWSPAHAEEERRGWLSRPITWILAFFVVSVVAVAGVFLFVTGSSGGMSTALLGAVGALLLVYLVGGVYLMARQRGHSSAMAVAESATVSGAVFLALVTVQLVALG